MQTMAYDDERHSGKNGTEHLAQAWQTGVSWCEWRSWHEARDHYDSSWQNNCDNKWHPDGNRNKHHSWKSMSPAKKKMCKPSRLQEAAWQNEKVRRGTVLVRVDGRTMCKHFSEFHIPDIVKSDGSIDEVAYEQIRDVELASNTMTRQCAGNMGLMLPTECRLSKQYQCWCRFRQESKKREMNVPAIL